MYIFFFFNSMIDKSVHVTDTRKAPKVKWLLFVLKYTRHNYLLWEKKKYSHTCNK